VLGADIGLALTYAPLPNRGALAALFSIDRAMGDVVRTTKEPLLGPIRLAWWRERLEELDDDGTAPAEPRLQQAAAELIPRGVTGRELAALESGWPRMFDPFPWTVQTSEAIWFRGNLLYNLGARVVGRADERIQGAGGLWTLVDAARHCSDPQSRAMLIAQARSFARGLAGVRFPGPLRPLSMLTVLAIRDCRRGEPFEREGTPGRAAAMLRHRFSGRLPKL
jgi:phytoene synthase